MVRLVLVSVLLLGLVAMATASRSGPHAASNELTLFVESKESNQLHALLDARVRPMSTILISDEKAHY